MGEIIIDVSANKVTLPEGIAAGDVGSVTIRLVNTPAEWSNKNVYAMISQHGESEVYSFTADDGEWVMGVPAQYLKVRGSFAVVAFATSIESAYRDVIPTVWVEVQEGLPIHADIMPADDEVGRLTAMIELAETYASQLGDMEAIKKKVDGIEEGAEVNVQADWAEMDPDSDAFIPNKPKIDIMLDPSSDNAIANHAVASEISALSDALIISRSQIEANASKIDLVDQKASDTKSELESHKRDFESLNSVVEAESEEFANHRQNAFPDEKHLTDSEKSDVGKIGKIEADLGDIASIQSAKSNIVEAYNELWDTVDKQGSKIYTAQSGVDNIMNGEVNVPVADFANQALTDTNGNYITDFYATKEELRPHPVYVMPSTLAPNVTYNFTTQPNITLAFPTVANDGDVIYITFECAETSTNLTVDTTNTSDFDLIPEVNTGYEIYAKYNGSIWIVKYSEYTVSEVA